MNLGDEPKHVSAPVAPEAPSANGAILASRDRARWRALLVVRAAHEQPARLSLRVLREAEALADTDRVRKRALHVVNVFACHQSDPMTNSLLEAERMR